MKDPWLNDIKRRVETFERDEPPGLWDSIERRRGARGAGRRAWLSAAAAAVVLLCITGVLRLQEPDAATVPAQDAPAASCGERVAAAPRRDVLAEQPWRPAAGGRVQACVPEPVPEPEAALPGGCPETAGADSVPVQAEAEPERCPRLPDCGPGLPERGGGHRMRPAARKRGGGFSLGVFTSGSGAFTQSRMSPGLPADNSPGHGGAEWEDNPVLGLLLLNKDFATQTRMSHRLPLTFGLSANYSISPSLSLESGLSYSLLVSDISDGSERHYYSGRRKLHYVGIPLKLRYRFASWRFMDFYVSAGVQMQKCVSGKVRKHYVIDSAVRATDSEDVCVEPLQWSAGAAAGVECRLTEGMGLYVEPGAGYWFDNGSDISTIYKEKPLNFNLNIGLRLNFGR